MKIRLPSFVALFAVATFSISALGATIENVRAQQRPNRNLVDIYYDLVAPEGGTFCVWLNVASLQSSPQMSTLDGDVGANVTPGRNRHIVWDAGTDWPGKFDENMVAFVATRQEVNGSGEMAWIPPGTNEGEDPDFGHYRLENRDGFWMDRTEVTHDKYKAVSEWARQHGYSLPSAEFIDKDHVYAYGADCETYVRSDKYDPRLGGRIVGERQSCILVDGALELYYRVRIENRPVVFSDARDIVPFCNARSEMEGRPPAYLDETGAPIRGRAHVSEVARINDAGGYRIPTEEEWEYAARGGLRGCRFPNGNELGEDDAAWTLCYFYPIDARNWYEGDKHGEDPYVHPKKHAAMREPRVYMCGSTDDDYSWSFYPGGASSVDELLGNMWAVSSPSGIDGYVLADEMRSWLAAGQFNVYWTFNPITADRVAFHDAWYLNSYSLWRKDISLTGNAALVRDGKDVPHTYAKLFGKDLKYADDPDLWLSEAQKINPDVTVEVRHCSFWPPDHRVSGLVYDYHVDYGQVVCSVGRFPPNGYGLYDMAGGVMEFAWSPSDGSFWNGRGGKAGGSRDSLRIGAKVKHYYYNLNFGIRCVLKGE